MTFRDTGVPPALTNQEQAGRIRTARKLVQTAALEQRIRGAERARGQEGLRFGRPASTRRIGVSTKHAGAAVGTGNAPHG